jgi:hypothetical protein
MTEAEWQACTDPQPMLEFLRGKASDRKLLLFACACYRRDWYVAMDKRGPMVAEILEHHADGVPLARPADERSLTLSVHEFDPNGWYAALGIAHHPASNADEQAARSNLLRELIGSLAFRTVSLDLSWHTASVVALAQAIYADRAFDRLPILADALEDAGCTSQDILAHCRGGGEHVRGCWVVDLLTGRE